MMDLNAFTKPIFDSINSIIECRVLGVSIFGWLALFVGLFLFFAALERKVC